MGNKSREILDTVSMAYFYCKVIRNNGNEIKDLIIEESNYNNFKITGFNELIYSENGILKFNIDFFSYLINLISDKKEITLDCLEIKSLSDDYIIVWCKKDSINEIKKLKDELTEQRKLLDLFIDSMPDFIFCKDINGRYTNCNRKFAECLEMKKEDIIGKYDYDIYDLAKAERFRKIDKDVISNNSKKTYIDTIKMPDGTTSIEKTMKVPYFDKDNNIAGVIGISKDISYEKAVENRLIKNENILFNILNHLEDVVIIKDKNKTIFVNDAFEKLYGISANEVYESNEFIVAYDSIHPEDKKLFENINYDEPLDKIARIVRKDNEIRWGWFRSNPLKDENNNTLRRIIIINDITNKKNEERQLDKLRMDFFANLSHEFKTPINLIFTSLQLLNFKIKNSKIEDRYDYLTYIDACQENTFRMIKLINNLIDSIEIEEGFFRYNPQNSEIVSFVEKICTKASDIAIKKSIEIIFDTEIEEKIVLFDLEHVERIILNILSNAIKFSKDLGKIEVYMCSKNSMIEIKIKDNGIGISKDKLEVLFDRFKMINNRMTKISEGCGIGLYIAKELAKLHGGDIEINSELGVGTEVIIKLLDNLGEQADLECAATAINNIDYSGTDRMKIEFSDIYLY
ncbi:ATP-binding protein [Eubacterium multiforme]|uniref:histidine kinase n=1 Tax=Eubacterium multiforme TaxID=83339 RepID=A0ABT9UNN4_9FIRM|nr:PAS domain-containing sensor histidine kinase [Eubacterium multiforme]MDQ0148250.1 PAS domain S-box-containing protein [Eubacterium multiforme]